MHLASLKYSLNHLELSANPRIDNDAIASLIVLTRLRFLYMAGTSITMTGVRKLAPALAHKTPEVVFEVPLACGEYLRSKPGLASMAHHHAITHYHSEQICICATSHTHAHP